MSVLSEKNLYKGTEMPQVCGVLFETFPTWAMRLLNWTTLYLTETKTMSSTVSWFDLNFQDDLLAIISAFTIRFLMMGNADVWLTSGSQSFLDHTVDPEGTPKMLCLVQSGRKRPIDSTSRTSFSVRLIVSHEPVGGLTSAWGVFGFE